MIEAAKSEWFGRWFAHHAEGRIRRTFAEVRVFGLETLRAALASGPVIVVSNHTAWWDPLVSLVLCRLLDADAYAMMDATNLRHRPFFAKVGAFGVSLDDPADGARAIRYAAQRLTTPGRLVWIFPQGREVPITAPVVFRPGSAEIARVARRAAVVPVALRYEHGRKPEPTVWIAVGPSQPARRNVDEGRESHERAVIGELDRIDRAVVLGEDHGFDVVFRKRVNRWTRAAERMLSWATRSRRQR